ncbi:hypothetical protein [Arthrobacter sp. CG_A4]|uniref:hypothetical protein n=1 Tax=Arthrobacter sp. CG_A4 TaxID=3071706 RepID=UPI002DFBFBA0|nr:hypothetical protein [Arthrobacter sp. CG_A4]
MGAVPNTVRWMVLADADEAMTLLNQAARMNGYRVLPPAVGEVIIEVPRSLLKRRPASHLAGSVAQTKRGTEIVWACGDDKHRSNDYLLSLEESLPAGVLYYHGIVEAAAASGVLFEGKKPFRNVVDTLGPDESVVAVARGKLGDDAGIVALTDRRLLFVEDGSLGPPPGLDAPLDSIGTLALGKRTTGETVGIMLASATVVISHMGYHGDGHGIVAKFRKLMKERARTPVISPVRHDDEERFGREEQQKPANGKSANTRATE